MSSYPILGELTPALRVSIKGFFNWTRHRLIRLWPLLDVVISVKGLRPRLGSTWRSLMASTIFCLTDFLNSPIKSSLLDGFCKLYLFRRNDIVLAFEPRSRPEKDTAWTKVTQRRSSRRSLLGHGCTQGFASEVRVTSSRSFIQKLLLRWKCTSTNRLSVHTGCTFSENCC